MLTMAALKPHMEAMHSNNERKYVCNICKKAYKSQSTLINHKKIHE
jgi:hypothetical protein